MPFRLCGTAAILTVGKYGREDVISGSRSASIRTGGVLSSRRSYINILLEKTVRRYNLPTP